MAIEHNLAGVVALLLLLALPGLLLVRAPLASVPSLSLAFWTLSAWWTPTAVGRERFLIAVLAGSGILALLRLRELVRPVLPMPALAVAVLALLQLAPYFAARPPRGAELSFHALAARLVVWNDGVPETLEPLAPVRPFGAHAPALATLAADVAQLSGLGVDRAVTLMVLAAGGLLFVGLFAAWSKRLPPFWAIAAALPGLAILRSPEVLAPFGQGAALLSLALAAGAAAILARRSSLPAAAAAGFVAGAAIVAHDLVGFLALIALLLGLAGSRKRVLVVAATAIASAAPQLGRLATALSTGTWRDVLRSSPLASHVAWPVAVAMLVALPWAADRLHRAPVRRQVIALALVLAMTVALECRRSVGVEPPPAQVIQWASRQDPTAVICISPDSSGIWIPAVAGRAVSAPHLPPVYRVPADISRQCRAPDIL